MSCTSASWESSIRSGSITSPVLCCNINVRELRRGSLAALSAAAMSAVLPSSGEGISAANVLSGPAPAAAASASSAGAASGTAEVSRMSGDEDGVPSSEEGSVEGGRLGISSSSGGEINSAVEYGMLGGGEPNGDGDGELIGELIGEGEGPPKPCDAPVSHARKSLVRCDDDNDEPPFPLREGGCFFFKAAGSELVVSPSNWSK